jgi:hypothetical protein
LTRSLLFSLAVVILIAGCRSDSTETGSPEGDAARAADTTSVEHQPKPAHRTISTLNPSETVVTMMEAYLDRRLGEYYSYVATVDRKAKSLDSLQTEFAPSAADIVTDFLFSNTDIEVDSTDVLGDSAIVYTTTTAPPVGFVVQQAQIVERDLGSSTDGKTKLDILGERYRLSGAPQEQNHGAFLLIREETGWRVIVGWADMGEALQGGDDPPGGT